MCTPCSYVLAYVSLFFCPDCCDCETETDKPRPENQHLLLPKEDFDPDPPQNCCLDLLSKFV